MADRNFQKKKRNDVRRKRRNIFFLFRSNMESIQSNLQIPFSILIQGECLNQWNLRGKDMSCLQRMGIRHILYWIWIVILGK